jgi:CheY-like chemotaxis protein
LSEAECYILVVDDDADIRDAIAEVLQEEGYESVAVGDGVSALQYLDNHSQPCMILLDWNMAPMNGREFMEAMRDQEQLASVPVVLVTADGRAEDKARQIRAAASLKKPLDIEALFQLASDFCNAPAT